MGESLHIVSRETIRDDFTGHNKVYDWKSEIAVT